MFGTFNKVYTPYPMQYLHSTTYHLMYDHALAYSFI